MGRDTNRSVWLGVGVGALLLLTVVLLVRLRTPEEEPPRRLRVEAAPPAPRAASPSEPREPPPPPKRVRVTRLPAAADPPPTPYPSPDASVRARPPLGVHVAPPAVPSELRQETDPKKRARLKRMHRVAVARVRASRLRRRAYQLQKTLARVREEGNWTPAKIGKTENDLRELRGAIKAADSELEQALKDVDR